MSVTTFIEPEDIPAIYAHFSSPITKLDCGKKCAPHNEHGIPFCCDTRHAVPSAYQAEWDYLKDETNLWRRWQADSPAETARLEAQTPNGQVLIQCLGHEQCQRGFRSLTCRAFPFFPYFTSRKEFIGLSYYWEYEDRCWVISNLKFVSLEYRAEFITAYDQIFELMPEEQENFQQHSAWMRKEFVRRRRAIPVLHRNGGVYKISPGNERQRRVAGETLPTFGVYQVTKALRFPDEVEEEFA